MAGRAGRCDVRLGRNECRLLIAVRDVPTVDARVSQLAIADGARMLYGGRDRRPSRWQAQRMAWRCGGTTDDVRLRAYVIEADYPTFQRLIITMTRELAVIDFDVPVDKLWDGNPYG